MAKPPLRSRFFIAVLPPQDVKTALYDRLAPLRPRYKEWGWKAPERYHISLQYPAGKAGIPHPDLPRLMNALHNLRMEMPTLNLAALDVLPLLVTDQEECILSTRFDVAAQETLQHLRDRIDDRMRKAGYQSSPDPFRPHLTVAKPPVAMMADAQRVAAQPAGPDILWTIESFHLIQAVFSKTGVMKYHPIAAYNLATGYEQRLADLAVPRR